MTPSAAPLARREPKVLVLGADPRIVLAIARSLGRRGLAVHLGWHGQAGVARTSRYVDRVHALPPPSLTGDAWLPPLRALLDAEAFQLVIPATEAAVLCVHAHRSVFTGYPEVCLLGEHAFDVVSNKERTYRVAASLGIPVPATRYVHAGVALDAELEGVRLPAMVKPIATARRDHVLDKRFACRVERIEDLRWYATHLLKTEPVIAVQEVLAGRGVGVGALAHEGRVLTAAQHERIHETVGYGSTYRRTAPLDPDLLAASQRFLKAIAYTGVALLEFRVEAQTGRWALIEINGRFWGSLPLAVGAGADFPYRLYGMWVHDARRFPGRHATEVRSRNLLADLRWTVRAWRRRPLLFPPRYDDEPGWVTNDVPRSRILAHLLRSLLRLDRVDTAAPDDPRPHREEWVALVRAAWPRAATASSAPASARGRRGD